MWSLPPSLAFESQLTRTIPSAADIHRCQRPFPHLHFCTSPFSSVSFIIIHICFFEIQVHHFKHWIFLLGFSESKLNYIKTNKQQTSTFNAGLNLDSATQFGLAANCALPGYIAVRNSYSDGITTLCHPVVAFAWWVCVRVRIYASWQQGNPSSLPAHDITSLISWPPLSCIW